MLKHHEKSVVPFHTTLMLIGGYDSHKLKPKPNCFNYFFFNDIRMEMWGKEMCYYQNVSFFRMVHEFSLFIQSTSWLLVQSTAGSFFRHVCVVYTGYSLGQVVNSQSLGILNSLIYGTIHVTKISILFKNKRML